MNENKTKDSKGFAALMRLIRPKQWIKNMFIFVPLFFGGALFHTDALLAGLITFIAYSFAASSIYCFNDIYDVEADRRHPVKCHRPIASGAVSVKQAYGLMFLMFALSMGACSPSPASCCSTVSSAALPIGSTDASCLWEHSVWNVILSISTLYSNT